ncbi:hypothetical protein [Allosalinactinospora lopnorensis]|uniref:hypothetical protein n=1 Tax=Allosalinactinospora lopnorensis TaxID=1352348 RepID=UPI000623D293|nr:hypothetical protein [Allosalinactinospora lopnorensis]
MMDLSPKERHALNDLVDQLVEATEDHAYWLGSVRQTSLELRERLTEWLDTEQPPSAAEPIQAHWQCPASGCRFSSSPPMSHSCPL